MHWGLLPEYLKNAIAITLMYQNNVTLISNSAPNAQLLIPPHAVGSLSIAKINCSNCEPFRTRFNNLHNQYPKLFSGYPADVELLNELRYQVLLNYMQSSRVDTIVMLDSDVSLFAPVALIFNEDLYRNCDVVLTWNQVSSRVMPVDPIALDAYWAGTARIDRPTLVSYIQMVNKLYTDPAMQQILLRKQKALPTINDMTSWCLFTLLQGGGTRPPHQLMHALMQSSLGSYARRHRVCNTQQNSWSGHHGIVHSASGEIQPSMMRFDHGAVYIDGSEYRRLYHSVRPTSEQWMILPPSRDNESFRLFTLHSKRISNRGLFRALYGSARRGRFEIPYE